MEHLSMYIEKLVGLSYDLDNEIATLRKCFHHIKMTLATGNK